MAFPKVTVVDSGPTAVLLLVELNRFHRRQFLVGQDSANSAPPFVTQVKARIQGVQEAFGWLMPKPVRQAIERGLEVKRQGDWFFYPATGGFEHRQGLYGTFLNQRLGKEFRPLALYHQREPTRHEVCDWGFPDRPGYIKGEVLHRCGGKFLVRGLVSAPDHAPLLLPDWHVAIRRRSVAGVGNPLGD